MASEFGEQLLSMTLATLTVNHSIKSIATESYS